MRFRIHFYLKNRTEYIDIGGKTIQEIRTKAFKEALLRKPLKWWSEEIN